MAGHPKPGGQGTGARHRPNFSRVRSFSFVPGICTAIHTPEARRFIRDLNRRAGLPN